MGDRTRPALFNIPAHRAFSDALAAGIIAQHGGDPMGLAQGMILLPTNRAIRAVSDAFVRHSGGGLLLPRLVAIGDPDLGEQAGSALDPLSEGEAIPRPDGAADFQPTDRRRSGNQTGASAWRSARSDAGGASARHRACESDAVR
jgi:hypothetical protein